MSTEAMKWAKRQQIVGRLKTVLMALAWYANKDGTGWPSQQSLADHTGLGVRTVRRALAELEDCNAIRRKPRSRGAMGRSSDHIELPLWRELTASAPKARRLLTGQVGRKEKSQPAKFVVPTGQVGQGIVSDQQTLCQERFEGSSETLRGEAVDAATPWPSFAVIAGGRN